jgi:transposase-like protein
VTILSLDGREHAPETVWRAQELYCVCRLSYAKVSEELGVAESTLKRWGQQYGWREKRADIAQAECDIRADTVLARSVMLKELIEERNPVVGFAVAKLEELALKQAEAERQGRLQEAQAVAEPPRCEIDTPADAAAALKEAIEIKLGRLLASPQGVDLKAVKEIKEALDFIKSLEPAAGKSTDKGLTAETVEAFRAKLLGG